MAYQYQHSQKRKWRYSAGQSNIEIVRTGILQKIRSLNIQIEDAKKAGNSSVYYASELFDSDKSAVYEKLGLIEQKIAELSKAIPG